MDGGSETTRAPARQQKQEAFRCEGGITGEDRYGFGVAIWFEAGGDRLPLRFLRRIARNRRAKFRQI
jgi:hypothetical protein